MWRVVKVRKGETVLHKRLWQRKIRGCVCHRGRGSRMRMGRCQTPGSDRTSHLRLSYERTPLSTTSNLLNLLSSSSKNSMKFLQKKSSMMLKSNSFYFYLKMSCKKLTNHSNKIQKECYLNYKTQNT